MTTDDRIHKNKVKTIFPGKNRLPPSTYELAVKTEKETENYDKHILVILFPEWYNEKQKIPSKIDYIMRTGGQKRLSGFPNPDGYAELQFKETLWPDYSKLEFVNDLWEFQQRKRRFGR